MNARHYVTDYELSETSTGSDEAEEFHGSLKDCHWCTRGHMYRAHRTSLLDFLISLVGIFPTVCSYCSTPGHRFYPKRLVALLCLATVAAGCFLVLRPKLVTAQNRKFERPSPVAFRRVEDTPAVKPAPNPNVDYPAQR